jgi:WhiB family transcriptional regulator, redox-sensing transcriptional regulator
LQAFRDRGRDPGWRTRGLCQSVDPETFFPAPSESAEAAIALCRTCPVRGSCLAWALEAGDLHGVWGGTTARERRAMAVVWRSGELDQLAPVTTVTAATGATSAAAAAPVGPPAPSMDRRELLRLVNAG